MSDQDQLEREVEAGLARLATRAVPDTERVPAPPWRQQERPSRTADVRRFGRATPWLVAAVLLVLAGLGLGAAMTFDASAPDRAPVGTEPPRPTTSTTAPDGTLGTPVPPPTSTPSFPRDSNGAEPDDGLGEFVAGAGTYGPLRIGMTRAELLAALGLDAGDVVESGIAGCGSAVLLPGHADSLGRPPRAQLDDGGVVIGFNPAADATDRLGNGPGTTVGQLRAAYPGGTVVAAQSGYVFEVVDGAGGLGFTLSGSTSPADSATVVGVTTGTVDFARGVTSCAP